MILTNILLTELKTVNILNLSNILVSENIDSLHHRIHFEKGNWLESYVDITLLKIENENITFLRELTHKNENKNNKLEKLNRTSAKINLTLNIKSEHIQFQNGDTVKKIYDIPVQVGYQEVDSKELLVIYLAPLHIYQSIQDKYNTFLNIKTQNTCEGYMNVAIDSLITDYELLIKYYLEKIDNKITF